VNLRIKRDLVETLIRIHEDHIQYVYPNGYNGTINFSSEEGLEIAKRVKSDPNRAKFIQIVDYLDLDMKRELIALMWLGKNDEYSVEQFPGLLERAVGVQDTAAEFLVGQSELSRCLREGMGKLGVI